MATVPITAAELSSALSEHDIVLLDLWASWCGPCRAFAPVFEQAALEHPDVLFGKVDTEAERDLAAGFHVTSIPTLLAFREGVLVFAQAGALSSAALERLITGVRNLDMTQVRHQAGLTESDEKERA
ncbi:thioredoxin family protein [Pseudoclavibacter soli]|uniref:thioredoxin family protein n=1 Tax=Pseudoclavibacter soli TaxID=452623 RepID=UPI0003FF8E24|nr:thioredoxin domain-containing protein [Pseudoclavibacter soli]